MTDRINALTVVLENDIRSDDVELLMTAINMIKGVLRVDKNVTDINSYVANERARMELGSKLWDVLHPKNKN